ncbi:MAG TPA: hypothetical protein VGM60_04645 [Pseudonocardia sp.]|jgi:ABC-type branched-subunit amino acid transport system substrate-binding protein|uniref:ABC transporter substrate-binding protein n=1 Tax=Pseudonocardia sp. TaxID=60912 RepID=UPI002F4182B6
MWQKLTHWWEPVATFWKWVIGIFAGLVLAALIGVPLTIILTHCPGQLSYQADQCVGVSDAGDVFDPALADVLGKIRLENQRIEALGQPTLSIGVLVSMPRPGDNPGLAISTREQLEGVYLAQHLANTLSTLGGTPLLRLVVGNAGEDTARWQSVVPDFIDRSQQQGNDRLVAVIASGDSLTPMLDAINQLFGAEIPVMPIRLTANQLSIDPSRVSFPLARPTPTNADQVRAAVTALKPSTRTALLVADTNPNDFYSTSLAAGFRASYPDATHLLIQPAETYDASLGGVANTMRGIMTSICQSQPDVVYFAGRSAALADFVRALPLRSCPNQRVRVATASDAVIFAADVGRDSSRNLARGLESNTEITFTALAHPDAWTSRPDAFLPGAIAPLRENCADCFRRLFGDDTLTDGSVITGYDSFRVASDAIRAPAGVNDSPAHVAQWLKRLHGPLAVAGASGWISLSDTGDPVNKAVPMLRIQPDGRLTFDQLVAPQGAPCDPARKPPNC